MFTGRALMLREAARARSPFQDWTSASRRYIVFHSLCFALYAILGKGFAYTGYGPLYIGEVLLATGLFVAIRTQKLSILVVQPLGLAMTCFFVWQALRTLPYLDTFGLNALRDGAIWGYSLFGWVTAALVLRLPKLPETAIRRYPSFGTVFMFAGPAAVLATKYLPGYLPAWPGMGITVPFLKYGDLCAHLAGASAFVVAGPGKGKSWWLFPALCGFLIGITGSRGGGLAFLGALAVVALLRFRVQKLIALATAIGIVGVAFCALDLHVPIPGTGREISSQQIISNITSISPSSSGDGELEATRRWRLEWWDRILDYTLSGPYFWTGKGYGINLTIDDGIQTSPDGPQALRSPHNSHLTFLARSGVPGFLLWSLVQLIWAGLIIRSYIRARAVGWTRWSGLLLWLLAYWTAFMINAAFDVSFEGPMSGIPFWTVFGFGWGVQILLSQKLAKRMPTASTKYAFHSSTNLHSRHESQPDELPTCLPTHRDMGARGHLQIRLPRHREPSHGGLRLASFPARHE